MSIVNRISPALFVVIILSFFMPFIEISCSDTSLGTFSGYDVMMGTASEKVQKDKKDDKSGFNIELMVALLAAVAGLGLGFLKKPLDKILPAVMALTGLICLIDFQVQPRQFGAIRQSVHGDCPGALQNRFLDCPAVLYCGHGSQCGTDFY